MIQSEHWASCEEQRGELSTLQPRPPPSAALPRGDSASSPPRLFHFFFSLDQPLARLKALHQVTRGRTDRVSLSPPHETGPPRARLATSVCRSEPPRLNSRFALSLPVCAKGSPNHERMVSAIVRMRAASSRLGRRGLASTPATRTRSNDSNDPLAPPPGDRLNRYS